MNTESFKYTFEEDVYSLHSKVLICVPTPWSMIKSNEKELLINILKAIKLTLDGVVLISEREIKLETIKIYNPFAVISFDCPIVGSLKTQEATVLNGMHLIQSQSLHDLIENKGEREKLWASLQQIFQPSTR